MTKVCSHAGTRHLLLKLRSIADLSQADEAALLDLPMTVEHHPARHKLLREGDSPSGCHLVLDGFACRHKSLPDGRRQILSFHTSGDMPDLQGLYLDTMDFGIQTLVPTVVGHIPHASLHDLMWQHLGIAQAFRRDTAIDGVIFREWLLGLGRRSAREHLAHMLCEAVMRQDAAGLPARELPLAEVDLADALGVEVVQVTREMQQLRKEGLVESRASRLDVLDLQGLARICNFDPAYLHQKRAP